MGRLILHFYDCVNTIYDNLLMILLILVINTHYVGQFSIPFEALIRAPGRSPCPLRVAKD